MWPFSFSLPRELDWPYRERSLGKGSAGKSSFENTFALSFSYSYGHVPAGLSCLGPELWPQEGSFKYLNSAVLPPLPHPRVQAASGSPPRLFQGGCTGRGASPAVLRDCRAGLLCPSMATHQPSCHCPCVGRGDLPQREAGDSSRSKQSLPEENLFDPQAAEMSHGVYSQSSVFPKYRIPASIKGASNQFDSNKGQAPTDNSSQWLYSRVIDTSHQTHAACYLLFIHHPGPLDVLLMPGQGYRSWGIDSKRFFRCIDYPKRDGHKFLCVPTPPLSLFKGKECPDFPPYFSLLRS